MGNAWQCVAQRWSEESMEKEVQVGYACPRGTGGTRHHTSCAGSAPDCGSGMQSICCGSFGVNAWQCVAQRGALEETEVAGDLAESSRTAVYFKPDYSNYWALPLQALALLGVI